MDGIPPPHQQVVCTIFLPDHSPSTPNAPTLNSISLQGIGLFTGSIAHRVAMLTPNGGTEPNDEGIRVLTLHIEQAITPLSSRSSSPHSLS